MRLAEQDRAVADYRQAVLGGLGYETPETVPTGYQADGPGNAAWQAALRDRKR